MAPHSLRSPAFTPELSVPRPYDRRKRIGEDELDLSEQHLKLHLRQSDADEELSSLLQGRLKELLRAPSNIKRSDVKQDVSVRGHRQRRLVQSTTHEPSRWCAKHSLDAGGSAAMSRARDISPSSESCGYDFVFNARISAAMGGSPPTTAVQHALTNSTPALLAARSRKKLLAARDMTHETSALCKGTIGGRRPLALSLDHRQATEAQGRETGLQNSSALALKIPCASIPHGLEVIRKDSGRRRFVKSNNNPRTR